MTVEQHLTSHTGACEAGQHDDCRNSDTSHQRLPREARILIAARAVDRLGGFTMGFLPVLLVAAYGASLRSAGLVAAGFGLATIPSRLLGGRLCGRDRHAGPRSCSG